MTSRNCSFRRCRTATFVLTALLMLASQSAMSQLMPGVDCGDPFQNAIGPFDYTNPEDRADSHRIPIVEAYHFNAQVESLQAGMSSVHVMDDLDYVLRAVPNHHRALYAVARYELQVGAANMSPRTAECYFERAIRFRPGDGIVHLIFGVFLHKAEKYAKAEEQYLRAIEIDDSLAEAHYNLGLLYLDEGQNDKALSSAKSAYKLGYPLQGLKQMLISSGDWESSSE